MLAPWEKYPEIPVAQQDGRWDTESPIMMSSKSGFIFKRGTTVQF